MKRDPAPPQSDPRFLLQRELERRCQANPRYSLRAFARALGISPTILSLVLTGKRPLSRRAAKSLAGVLALSADEALSLAEWSSKTPRKRLRDSARAPESAPAAETNAYQMSLDSFALISDWYHFAILSLLDIPGSRFEARWISRHLGITEIEARNAMERLQRMGIVENVDGRWKQAVGPIRIGNNVPTSATKRFQKQLMLKAIESIENDPDETRDFSSITFALDPALVPLARERIRQFRRRLSEELESKGSPERVYKLTVQIFPVSREIEKKENQV